MANEVITDEMLKAAFGRGKVPTGSSYSNLIDYIKQHQGGNGLKQVDLATYAGTVNEIVQHIGTTYKGPDNANTPGGYVHGHIYEYVGAVSEDFNLPSDTLVVRDGYNTTWTDGVCKPDPENNPEWFEEYKTVYPFPWVYNRETQIYQWWGRSNYSHFSVYTRSKTPQVGDNVYITQGHVGGGYHGQSYSMGTVKTVENTSGDWRYTAIEVQWLGTNGQYESVWYGVTDTTISANPAGQERTCGVFTTANNDELVIIGYTPSNIDWARMQCATLTPILDFSGSDMELSYAQVNNYDRFNNVRYDVINTALYVPMNVPAHWERLIQLPNTVSVVIPLYSGVSISGWSGGQYEPIDVENIVNYYSAENPEIINPNIVVVENAGVSVNGEPLYVRTMAQGQSFITTIPYGHSAIFTKASEESNYYPATTTITITEYELAELAQGGSSGSGSSGSGGSDSYGGDYSEGY